MLLIVSSLMIFSFAPIMKVASTNSEVEVILTGDIMLGRTVATTSLDKKSDPNYPFIKVNDRLRSADVVFANLESPVATNCPRTYEGLIFCADPKMAEGLVYAGVDVVTLANNHILNYGQKGLTETTKVLNENGIAYTGLGNLVIKEIKGTKFGFLGFEFIDKWPVQDDYDLVAKSDSKVDVLIVGVHWGAEYRENRSDKQNEIAKKLVFNGADVIAGHHPHWVQEVEHINGKPVYYSLGNFVFDQMWSEKTREGLAIRLTFRDGKIVKEESLPVYIENWAQPAWVN